MKNPNVHRFSTFYRLTKSRAKSLQATFCKPEIVDSLVLLSTYSLKNLLFFFNIFESKKIANCCENVAKICAKKTNAPEIPKRTLSKINSKILIRDFIRKTSQIGKEINV